MMKMNGVAYDIPDAQRGFHRYDSISRADRAASFRLTPGQRSSVGEVFWTHPLVDGVCFPSRKLAREAGLRAAGIHN